MTVLTGVIVAEQYVFAHVPEPHLFALLVLLALYVGVLEQLCIELRDLDDGLCHRQERMDLAHERQVRLDRLFDGRGEPAVRPCAVVEARSTVACLTAASCPAGFSSC